MRALLDCITKKFCVLHTKLPQIIIAKNKEFMMKEMPSKPDLYSGSVMSNGVPKLHVIGIDLERDDLSALKYLFEISNLHDQFIFCVGEGPEASLKHRAYFMSHCLDLYLKDNPSKQFIKDNSTIVIGSHTPKQNDYAKIYYDTNFIQKFEISKEEYKKGLEAKQHIIDIIEKNKDKQIIFHLWKPMRDLPEIINELRNKKILDEYDMVIASGSYNANMLVREAYDKKLNSLLSNEVNYDKAKEINHALNGYYGNDTEKPDNWYTNNILFESNFAFQRPDTENFLKAYNKHIFNSGRGDDADGNEKLVNELAGKLRADKSNWGNMANRSALIWNKGISEGCMKDCIIELQKIIGNTTGTRIKSYRDLGNLSHQMEFLMSEEDNDLSDVNKMFIDEINKCLSQVGFFREQELIKIKNKYIDRIDSDGVIKFITGSEQRIEDFPEEFVNQLRQHNSVEKVYDWNLQVILAVTIDSHEILFGDLICSMFLARPDLFHTKTSDVMYHQNEKGYLSEPDGKGVCKRIYGINDFKALVEDASKFLVKGYDSPVSDDGVVIDNSSEYKNFLEWSNVINSAGTASQDDGSELSTMIRPDHMSFAKEITKELPAQVDECATCLGQIEDKFSADNDVD